jgi:hypothetical protein
MKIALLLSFGKKKKRAPKVRRMLIELLAAVPSIREVNNQVEKGRPFFFEK